MTALHQDASVVAWGTAALRELTGHSSALRRATLLTDDGFEVASVPAQAPDGRLASMASSIQALTEGVAHELAIGSSQFVMIASDSGHVIQLRVPGQGLVLAAVFDADGGLAPALSASRIAAERLGAALAAR
jgi:predicted regulator of Ras-like GTPase activity (Roadblock/LC7/MglB family)